MSAIVDLTDALIAGGMSPGEAAALVAQAIVDGSTKPRSSGAKRTAKWRENKRHKASQNVTGDAEAESVTVTSQASQSVTCDATSLPSSSPFPSPPITPLTLSPPPTLPPSTSLRSVEAAKRATRLPDDWQPSDSDFSYASRQGLRLVEIEIEATKFRNYWTAKSGRDATKLDWSRTWQNWVLNARGTRNGTQRPAKQSGSELALELADEVRRVEAAAGLRRSDEPFGSA